MYELKFDCLVDKMLPNNYLIDNQHHLSMHSQTQFKQTYLHDILHI